MYGVAVGLSIISRIISTVTSKQYDSYGEIGAAVINEFGATDSQLLIMNGSTTKLASKFMIQPMIVVSESLRNTQNIDKVIDLNMDVFAAFYMQSFETLRTMFGKDVLTTVDILGTGNGSLIKGGLNSLNFLKGSSESYEKDYIRELFSNESLDIAIEDDTTKNGNVKAYAAVKPTEFGKDGASNNSVIVYRNLNIATTIKIKIGDKPSDYNIILPLMIRADVRFASPDNILLIMKPNSAEKTLAMRWLDHKAGVVSWRELLTASDLIKEYKENKFKDKAGLLDAINNRVISANSKITYDKTVGFEKYYQMYILNSDELLMFKKQVNGDILKNERARQEMLEQLLGMSCTIIDNDWERGHLFLKDLPGESMFSLKSLGKRKDSQVDLSEIVRALLGNKPPVF